jgi:quinol monooxygenase YgiN
MPKSKRKRAARPHSSQRRIRIAKTSKLPKSAVTLVVILRAKDGQHLLLEAELRALVGPTRKEAGCLQYDLHAAADQPGCYLLHEVWASREHHGLHTRTPHFLRWNARKDALLASRESAFYHQIV